MAKNRLYHDGIDAEYIGMLQAAARIVISPGVQFASRFWDVEFGASSVLVWRIRLASQKTLTTKGVNHRNSIQRIE